MRKSDSHLDFDLEVAKHQSADNPVYYIQYAHARIWSIKGFSDKTQNDVDNLKLDFELLAEPEELELARHLIPERRNRGPRDLVERCCTRAELLRLLGVVARRVQHKRPLRVDRGVEHLDLRHLEHPLRLSRPSPAGRGGACAGGAPAAKALR